MSKKNQRKGIFAVVGAVAIVAIGGSYLWARTIIGKELSPAEAAEMVPEEAWMATYISTKSKSWSKLTEFGSNKAKDMLDEELDYVSRQLSSNDIDYHKDIEPWLGSMMIATFPPDEGKSMMKQENLNVLGVLGIKNKFEAGMFINKKIKGKVNSNDLNDFQERIYKGVIIIETKTPTNELLNTALMDDRLIMASNREVMNKTIDTIQGGRSFEDKIKEQEMVPKKLGKQTTLIKIYMPDYATLMKTSLRSSPKTRLAARTVDKINDVEAIMMGVGVNDRGIHFQTLAKLKEEENRQRTRRIPGDILSSLPNNTIALVNVENLDRTWSSLLDRAAKDRILKFNLNKYKKSFETSMNLDLDRDVFSWMDGEFALALIPADRGFLADYGLAGMAMWTTSDRSRAEETLKKLEAKTESFNDISVRKRNLNGTEITEWINFQGKDILSYGWVDDSSLLLTFGTPPDQTLDIQANKSISKDKTFTTVTSYLPKTNQGYLYINNLDAIIAVLDRLFEDTSYSVIPEARAALTSVEAIAVTTSEPKPFFSQLDIMVSLKSNNKN
ncbi:MAG: DUF3352 domain-containing protein [Prochloraceae cyanobacterium]|nr:DUF3352 domain-containing protein [Prochloraceae cyanobacterium]